MEGATGVILGIVTRTLRAHIPTWTITAMLPLPILVVIDPGASSDISCVYLGLGCGWLAMEIYRGGGLPESLRDWAGKMLAICIAAAVNAAIFILFGLAAGVQTGFPFPLMAALSVVPAIGLIPFFVQRVRQPYMAIVLGCVLVLASKLGACVVARIRYGPHFIEDGYVSEDWHAARMMISLFWVFCTGLSLILLVVEYAGCRQREGRIAADAGNIGA
jgi:hypothetical protein